MTVTKSGQNEYMTMMKRFSSPKKAAMHTVIQRAGVLIAALALSLPALADPVDEAIRARLEPLASVPPPGVASAAIPRAEVTFYAQRQWQPVWDEARYQSLLAVLADIETDGLDPEDYSLSLLTSLPRDGDPQTAAERDMLATRAYLLALLHLYHGKVDPRRLDSRWNFDARQFDPDNGLALAREAVERGDIAGIFQRARPNAPQYASLRAALAHLRAMAQNGDWPAVPAGPTLKPGAHDARVPLLRQRLQSAGLLPPGEAEQPEIYDPALVAAVRQFQQESYLDADGALGARTMAALNVPLRQRIDQVRVNLERARWLLHEFDRGDFVIVDVAGYRIAYVHDGQVKWRSRVQIGKEYRATPIFKSAITRVTLSPGWVIPPTILREDTLPAIRRDSGYLARNRLSVYRDGQEVPAASVDWNNPGKVTLRQEPGPNGSLGEVVIRFANPYAIYLHDTPHRRLFDSSRRATSSGCIRVENIHELAELLLDDPQKWNRDALRTVIDERKTREAPLKNPVPILLAYWTVDVGDDGHVAFKPDVYKHDGAVLAALNEAGA